MSHKSCIQGGFNASNPLLKRVITHMFVGIDQLGLSLPIENRNNSNSFCDSFMGIVTSFRQCAWNSSQLSPSVYDFCYMLLHEWKERGLFPRKFQGLDFLSINSASFCYIVNANFQSICGESCSP